MLILSRNIGEAILIGDDISVTISNVQGGQVRLAIDAPKSVAVDRAEIRQRKIESPRLAEQIVPPVSPTAVDQPLHIDQRIKDAAAEEMFLTIVFKLPNAQSAGPLINQLPYGQLALGTQAKVFGMTTGNLMEVEPCEA